MKSAAGVTYTYDGNGNRVEKSSGTLYWRGLDGSLVAETDASGNTLNEYIYFDGNRVAGRNASGNVYYFFSDTLGSEVSITNATGTPCYDADSYLFGGEKIFTNNCPPDFGFAGMEQDTETGLNHTLNRQYSSQFGRWLSPDPLGGDVTNPQSLNRYAYVLNNPTSLTDPLGLANEGAANTCEPYGSCPQTCDPSLDMDCIPGCSYYDPTCSQGCVLDGMSMPCQEISLIMPAGSTFECPDGGCWIYGKDPYTGGPAFIDLTEDAAGNSGYLSLYDWTKGVNGINGTFLSDAAFQAYLREKYFQAIWGQLMATIHAMQAMGIDTKTFFDYVSKNFNEIFVEGGNANFPMYNNSMEPLFDLSKVDCKSERCDKHALGTLDFSHNNGFFHLDTGDPWHLSGIASHIGVDLFLGNTTYWVIPR